MPARNREEAEASNQFEFLQKQKCRFTSQKVRNKESQTDP
jgi:hypothetical protein